MILSGKTCVVTGAGRGIGRSTAEAFAGSGANLALCARSVGELEEARDSISQQFGIEPLIQSVDVADSETVTSFATTVQDRFGGIDVLVNNAGVYGPVGSILDVPFDSWARTIEINLFGVVHVIRSFVPIMAAAGGGRIINLAGGGVGGRTLAPNVSAYTASKAAVVCLTETLARELAPSQIWINVVAPGAISTKLIDSVIEAGPDLAGSEFYEQSLRQRESGDPIEKVQELMMFLASERSSNITGKLLSAKWDPIEELSAEPSRLNESSLYTLRRIDGQLFFEAGS